MSTGRINKPQRAETRSQACLGCRKRHTKCPRGNPCANCVKISANCEYAESDKKVLMSLRYLQNLQNEIADLKQQNAFLRSGPSTLAAASPSFSSSSVSLKHVQQQNELTSQEPTLNEVVPPFIDRQRRLVSSKTGEKFYVGSSSMTLFGLEVESMIPDHMTSNTANGEASTDTKLRTVLEREGNAYKISLGETDARPGLSVKFVLPSYSYALLLIDTFITYNDGCFYFFNEGLVKESLRRTYSLAAASQELSRDSILETIDFCKFLLIFAIGEMYLGTAQTASGTKLSAPRLPGSRFFQQASDLFTGLFAAGAIDNVARQGGVEVMLLYAFYLQVADCTVASYFYFGIALRASLILGMHVDVEKDTLCRYELEHRRRLWWTIYMFERMLSSKAGLPLSLSDESILTELPLDFDTSVSPANGKTYIFPEAEYIRNCVTIVQINSLILSSLYQKEPTTNILPVISDLITQLFNWKENLPDFLKPNFRTSDLKISRLVTNLMTEYFQGINLAVRPLLFYLATKKIKLYKTTDKYIDLSQYSSSILTLLNASFQGSINTVRSLWALMPENMVALFGYMDREYLFTCAATLILFNLAFGVYEATKESLDHALFMFTKMRNLGNNPAELRREQLIKLLQTLNFNNKSSDILNKYRDGAPLETVTTQTKPQSTFNSKLFNKKKRESVNNNRFIYQKPAYVTANHPVSNTRGSSEELESKSAPVTNSDSVPTSQNLQKLIGALPALEPEDKSDSLDLLFNNILDQEQFSSANNVSDTELWHEITSQQTWLNDVSEEFQNLINDLAD